MLQNHAGKVVQFFHMHDIKKTLPRGYFLLEVSKNFPVSIKIIIVSLHK